MKIKIHPLFYLFLIISIFTAHFKECIIITTMILFHELGHILVSLIYGWKIERVNILPVGAHTVFKEELNRPIYEEFMIVLAGPIFQTIYNYYIPNPYHIKLLLFNLLPIYPLDGSKILFLISNIFISYYHSYDVIIISSLISIIFILRNKYLFLIGLYTIYKSLELINNKNNYFNMFLYERYVHKYKFYLTKILHNKTIFQMKRDYKHVFIENNGIITEKDKLKSLYECK